MLLHKKKATAQQQVNRAAQQVAADVSTQIAEPVLHVARWALLIALLDFVLVCIALGLAIFK